MKILGSIYRTKIKLWQKLIFFKVLASLKAGKIIRVNRTKNIAGHLINNVPYLSVTVNLMNMEHGIKVVSPFDVFAFSLKLKKRGILKEHACKPCHQGIMDAVIDFFRGSHVDRSPKCPRKSV